MKPASTVKRRATLISWSLGILAAVLVIARIAGRQDDDSTDSGAGIDSPDHWRSGRARLCEEGGGFVVWESNRTGNWRLWRCELDGSGLRQITPDEPARDHICPHISPDGKRVVYLNFPEGVGTKKEKESREPACLQIMESDGRSHRILAPAAMKSTGNRAAVWVDNNTVIYLDSKKITHELDITTGKSFQAITNETGYLVNATRTYAMNRRHYFAYDPESRTLTKQGKRHGGCEPYVSHDGVWGFRVMGAGGPLSRVHLATEEMSSILEKDDPRMPAERNYAYFPMFSRCQRLFAFAASPDQHDHYKSDYDIFVCLADPKTLALIGRPVRYSFDPGTDKYPDVFLAELELGRFQGEAPFTVHFSASELTGNPSLWRWDYGDDSPDGMAGITHSYTRPGRYVVAAERGNRRVRGSVTVEPSKPPEPTSATLRDGKHILVGFSEPVDVTKVDARLESGVRVVKSELTPDRRAVVVVLAGALDKQDRLHLVGIKDLAQRPNTMEPAVLEVAPLLWPSNREGLVFAWQTANDTIAVSHSISGKAHTFTLKPRGGARLDHDFGMVTWEGAFLAKDADQHLTKTLKASGELTVEATIKPLGTHTGKASIIAFSTGPTVGNFILGQDRDQLVFGLRTADEKGGDHVRRANLCSRSSGKKIHITVAHRQGKTCCYIDGRRVATTDKFEGDFSSWTQHHLTFGDQWSGGRSWNGTIEGVAIYSRTLGIEEVRANYEAYRGIAASRPPVQVWSVSARLLAKSDMPTLKQIAPYREALALYEYEVAEADDDLAAGTVIRVAHWVLLDGDKQPAAALTPGTVVSLRLSALDRNKQLKSNFMSDTLDLAPDTPLYHSMLPPSRAE